MSVHGSSEQSKVLVLAEGLGVRVALPVSDNQSRSGEENRNSLQLENGHCIKHTHLGAEVHMRIDALFKPGRARIQVNR